MPFDQSSYQPTDPVLKCLQDARQWLSDPAHWVKGHYNAGDASCAHGAVCRIGLSTDLTIKAWHLLDEACPLGTPNPFTPIFNDDPTTTHADVLALFDRAIAARRAAVLADQSAS